MEPVFRRQRLHAAGAMALILTLLLVLSGCAAPSGFGAAPGFGDLDEMGDADGRRPAVVGDRGLDSWQRAAEPTLVRGTNRMFATPGEAPGFAVSGEAVSLQFEQAPVEQVIHAVLGDILELPYVISQSVGGSVTVRTSRAIERDQVLPMLEALLAANGLALVRDAGGVFHVGTPDALRTVAPSITLAASPVPGRRLVVVPLQYIGAAEMAELLAPVARPEAFVRVDGLRNLLVLAGSSNQIEGWTEIVRTFDVDVLRGLSVGLFPLEHLSVEEAEAALNLVLASGGGAAPGPGSGDPGGRALGGPLGSVVRFVGIQRLNAILVVTPRSHYLDKAREWIERFDVPYRTAEEPRLFVYPVQNGNATHLASLLSAVFGGTGPAAPAPVDPGVAPGLQPAALRSPGSPQGSAGGGDGALSIPQPVLPGSGAAQAGTAAAGLNLPGEVRVVGDEFNNAVLIFATGAEYQKIEAALRQLDRAPTQVLIEASIIEVTLANELEYGLEWFFRMGVGSDYTGGGLLNLRPSGPIGPAQPGFSYTIRNAGADVRVVLNALAERALVKVLSSPNVLVLDNHTAVIQVGDQVPVQSSTTTTDGGRETVSIQYRDTGVHLAVTPSVNAGGMVSLGIDQSVTDVGTVDAATGQRRFLQRQINSRVAIRSGETVVLGGLIRDNVTTGRQGVPVLHDIPVVGNLFGKTTDSRNRTELLVMLTPRVLETEADLRGISEEIRRKMGRVDDLVREMGYEPRGTGNGVADEGRQ